MKLKLTQVGDVAILEVSNEIEANSAGVLNAGLKKLFQSGKNKITLNLLAAEKITREFVAELLKFEALATELSGHIVIVSKGVLSPQLKTVTTTEEAVQILAALGAAKAEPIIPDEPDVPIDPKDPFGEVRARLKKAEGRNAKLKAKLQGLKIEEYEKFRFENSIMSKQIEAIQEQITALNNPRRKVLPADQFIPKVGVLDKAFIDFLSTDGLIAKEKK